MLPRHRMGLDFTVDKALHLVAQSLVFGEVVDVVHGAAHVIKKMERCMGYAARNWSGCSWLTCGKHQNVCLQ